jgi:hypothetical protein
MLVEIVETTCLGGANVAGRAVRCIVTRRRFARRLSDAGPQRAIAPLVREIADRSLGTELRIAFFQS